MSNRKLAAGLGIAAALVATFAVANETTWVITNDEAGSRLVTPRSGTVSKYTALPGAKALAPGDISTDRQYVFVGEEAGWQPRAMEYRIKGSRLVHIDDPVGHMDRSADSRPATDAQRAALQRSGGS